MQLISGMQTLLISEFNKASVEYVSSLSPTCDRYLGKVRIAVA
jgi:hypothetical protein